MLVLAVAVNAQERDEKLVKRWKETKNDSVFVSGLSVYKYQVFEIRKNTPGDELEDWIDSAIFRLPAGEVLGPVGKHDTVFYVKVLNADSTQILHLDGLTFPLYAFPKDSAEFYAKPYLERMKRGENLDSICLAAHRYYGRNVDCSDLLFYATEAQPPLNEDLPKLHAGEYYAGQTSYTYHVLHTVDNPRNERKSCRFVVLAVKVKSKPKKS